MVRSALLLTLLLGACAGPPPPLPSMVVLFGIDGAEWDVIEPLREAGRLPALDGLIARGTRGEIGTFRPTLSPALWTTVATGLMPEAHGVRGFALERPEVAFDLPRLPTGDLTLRLEVAVAPPCGTEALQVRVNGVPVGMRTGGEVPLPAARRRAAGDTLTLRLPAHCAARPKVGPWPPWGRLDAIEVRAAGGRVVGRPAPADTVRDRRAVAPRDAGGTWLVGRLFAQTESTDRRAPAIWNVASSRGRSVGVVGWWCTWPAEVVRGTMISDFLVFASTRRLLDLATMSADVLDQGAVHPAAARAMVAEALPARWELDAAELGTFVPRSSPRFAEMLAAPARVRALSDAPLTILKDTYLINRPYFALARRLAAEARPELLLAYTNLVDAVEHKFWRYYEPERFENVAADEIADLGDVIPATYVHVDAEIGRLLSALPDDAAVIVLSDHGHHAARTDGVFSGEHGDAPPGILVAAGPGIRAGARIDGATLLDVMPTLLALLGLPVAADLPGRVLEDLFTSAPHVEHVPTYRDVAWETAVAPSAGALDASVRERLRALGYLSD